MSQQVGVRGKAAAFQASIPSSPGVPTSRGYHSIPFRTTDLSEAAGWATEAAPRCGLSAHVVMFTQAVGCVAFIGHLVYMSIGTRKTQGGRGQKGAPSNSPGHLWLSGLPTPLLLPPLTHYSSSLSSQAHPLQALLGATVGSGPHHCVCLPSPGCFLSNILLVVLCYGRELCGPGAILSDDDGALGCPEA